MQSCVKWVLILLCFVHQSLGVCECGRGGLCVKVRGRLISGWPCHCDLVSRGIFQSAPTHCDALEDSYCVAKPCHHNAPCLKGFGTYYCECSPQYVTQTCGKLWVALVQSREFHVWFPVQGMKRFEPFIVAQIILFIPKLGVSGDRYTFYFDDGRIWTRNILSCDIRKSQEMMAKCSERGGGEDCTIVSRLISRSLFFYSCVTPLGYKPERSVYVNGITGPVGQYHDVRIEVMDVVYFFVHFDVTYRVFVETGELNRVCPITVTLEGCSDSAGTATYVKLLYPHTVSATVHMHNPDNLCPVKRKEYRWSIAPFYRWNTGELEAIAEGQTITFTPSNVSSKFIYGTYTIECDITFLDAPNFPLETVTPMCFIEFERKIFTIQIDDSQLYYLCESNVTVFIDPFFNQRTASPSSLFPNPLNPYIATEDEIDDEYKYTWECSPEFEACVNSTVNKNRRELTFSTNDSCGSTYELKLHVKYVPTVTSDPWPFDQTFGPIYRDFYWEGNVSFVKPGEHIRIRCDPDCANVNPAQPLSITVTNAPSISQNLNWKYWEEVNKTWVEPKSGYVINEECRVSLPHIFMIPALTLKSDTKYKFTVRSGLFDRPPNYPEDKLELIRDIPVTTASPPLSLSCHVTPPSGVRLVQKFNISCNVLSPQRHLTFYVKEGPDMELVSVSPNNHTENILLSLTPVLVEVEDLAGLKTSTNVTITLTGTGHESSDYKVFLNSVPSRLVAIRSLLSDQGYLEVARQIDLITRIGNFNLKFKWKMALMKFLVRIRQCVWAECIVRTINSVKRLITFEDRPKGYFEGVGELIFLASHTIYTMSRSLERITPKAPLYQAYVMIDLLNSIHKLSRQIMEFYDRTLGDVTADEDYRWIHYRKQYQGITFLRWALAKIGLFIAQHVPHPGHPFVLRIGSEETMVVVSHYAEYINCIAATHNQSYFQFSPETVEYLMVTDTPVAVAIVSYKKHYWWYGQSNKSFGHPVDVHLYLQPDKNGEWVQQISTGWVQTYIRSVAFSLEAITGKVPHVSNFKPTEIPMVAMYRIVLERGYGSVLVYFPEYLVGHIFFSYDIVFPINYDTYEVTPLGDTNLIIFNYYNTEPRRHLYLGISNHLEVSSFKFNMTIVKCVEYSERMWKGETCIFAGYAVNKSLVCECNDMDLLSAVAHIPEYEPVNQLEIHIDTSTINWKADLEMLALLIIPILAVLITLYYDKKKPKENVLLPDDTWPGDGYAYLIAVYTGTRCMSGTSANVALRIIGDGSASRVHILKSNDHVPLKWTRDSWFILLTPKGLGNVEQIQMWHDNHGLNPDWYGTQIVMWDIVEGKRFTFPLHATLSYSQLYLKDETSFTFEKITERRKWQSFIKNHMIAKIRQDHHLISIFAIHPRNIYTRLDRVVIFIVVVLVALSCTMGFYMEASGPADRDNVTLTWFDLKVAMAATSVAFMFGVILTWLFRIGRQQLLELVLGKYTKSKIKNQFLNWLARPVACYPVMTRKVRQSRLAWNRWMTVAYCVSAVVVLMCNAWIVSTAQRMNYNQGAVVFMLSTIVIGCEGIFDLIQITIISTFIAYMTRAPPTDLVFINIDHITDVQERQISKALDLSLHRRTKPMYKPPLRSKIRKRAIFDAGRDLFDTSHIISIVLLFVLVFLICYFLGSRHNMSELSNISQEELKNIQDTTNYYRYMRETVVRGLHRYQWYNGKSLVLNENISQIIHMNNTGFGSDYSTKVIGVPEFRQQRVAPEYQHRIPTPFKGWFSRADGALTTFNKETKSCLPMWKPQVVSLVHYRMFHYWTSKQTNAGPVIGPSRYIYDGSGHVARLHWSSGRSRSKLTDLQFDIWIDNATRILFLTFNQYNLNEKRISYVTIVTECLASGVYRFRTIARSASLIHDVIILVFVLGIFVVVTVLLIRLLAIRSKLGSEWCTHFVVQFFGYSVVLFGYILVISLISRYLQLFSIIEEVESAPRDHYIPLQPRFHQSDTALVLIGVFILIVAVFGCAIVHNLICFEGVNIFSIRLREMIVGFGFIVLFSSYLTLYAYHISSAQIRYLFFSLLLKEFAPVGDNLFVVSFNVNHFVILFPIVIVLARINVTIFCRFYAESVAPFERKLKLFDQLFAEQHFIDAIKPRIWNLPASQAFSKTTDGQED